MKIFANNGVDMSGGKSEKATQRRHLIPFGCKLSQRLLFSNTVLGAGVTGVP